jgi:hypothetical protein
LRGRILLRLRDGSSWTNHLHAQALEQTFHGPCDVPSMLDYKDTYTSEFRIVPFA